MLLIGVVSKELLLPVIGAEALKDMRSIFK